MNPISEEIKIGTIGEILVQLRLLQYNVQSAPALKDSGNDLIAVKGDVFKAIQVKTTTKEKFNLPNLHKYHILALVKLVGENDSIYLDKSRIFLLQESEAEKTSYKINELSGKVLSKERVVELF
jgi:Holliday junction resolvase